MTTQNAPMSSPSIGFLTVTRDSEQALYGGFLILNSLGRPLEFHCTAPVRPSRAQQILYGPALDPYLFGERIGQTLITAARRQPALVVTDRTPVMAARPQVACPLVLLDTRGETASAVEPDVPSARRFHRFDTPHAASPPCWVRLERFQVDGYRLAVATDHAEDRPAIEPPWHQFANQLDLYEPFERIRQAIQEARGGKREN